MPIGHLPSSHRHCHCQLSLPLPLSPRSLSSPFAIHCCLCCYCSCTGSTDETLRNEELPGDHNLDFPTGSNLTYILSGTSQMSDANLQRSCLHTTYARCRTPSAPSGAGPHPLFRHAGMQVIQASITVAQRPFLQLQCLYTLTALWFMRFVPFFSLRNSLVVVRTVSNTTVPPRRVLKPLSLSIQ